MVLAGRGAETLGSAGLRAGAVFVGSSEHNLDSKGRLVLPHKFREELEGHAYLSFSVDGVLQLWKSSEFLRRMNTLEAKLEDDPESVRRFRVLNSFSSEVDVEPSQGRIAIPAKLRELAKLATNKPVLITGNYKNIELWNPDDFSRRVLLIEPNQGGSPA